MEGTFIAPHLKRKFRRTESHPLYKYISSHGDFECLDISITSELRSETAIKLDSIIITDNWIISMNPNLNLLHISDIVWAYKKIYTNKYSFQDPNTYILVMKSKNRHAVSITTNIEFVAKGSTVDTALEILSRRIPYAFFGYYDKLKNLWDDNKKVFIQLVEEERLKDLNSK